MTKAVSICIEDITPGCQPCFMRCAAIADRDNGLGLCVDGTIAWQSGEQAIDLCASGEDPAVLRRADAPEAVIHRAGRELPVPQDGPMVLLNGDELAFGELRFRIHVHGPTNAVTPPEEVHPDIPPVSADAETLSPVAAPPGGPPPPPPDLEPPELPEPVKAKNKTPTPPRDDDPMSLLENAAQEGEKPIGVSDMTPEAPIDVIRRTPVPPRFPDPRSATCLMILIIILILAAAAWAVKTFFF